ncbi:acVLRF1 family peptidyl-tRNA hydrolase [Arthrobacter sp. CJ23]|uniref:acVLRF1 family peptidyl-tRNA hydrolase n=1 Tax=Arthrobacter sp. CJ23 TaxID=2972479 RepID=UPI00215CB84C|nr:acVLRF1 family peptidyl-tRNA hydrolase [Arthrobacter sp. CJ23]UVJ37882.1 acVLRF1 family peptidyl-tRNA hydrolase [Arthrobacter sp. CJ23]
MDRPHVGQQATEPRPVSRTAFVQGARLSGWVQRFAASHGRLADEILDGGILLQAADGATALLKAPWPVDGRPGTGADHLERLASLAAQERGLGLLLVRRGGFAVAAASGGRVLASKTGTRYVQSRTAAGGQSQQRYARRRGNQADALVESAAEHAARVFGAHRVEYLVPGGDRLLVEQVLEQPAMKQFAARSRLAFLDIPEPKAAALAKAAADACAIRILVTDPPA